MNTINPYMIKDDGIIRVVFSSHAWGMISWLIRARTQSMWNHVMWMVSPGEFVSQGLLFKYVPFDKYFEPGVRIKVWEIHSLTPGQTGQVLKAINDKVNQHWWKRKYDVLGIIGQLFGVKKLNNPWSNYCSEQVAEVLRRLKDDECARIFPGLRAKASPEDIDDYFSRNNAYFKYAGSWTAPR